MVYEVGDIVKLKKPHPCGSHEWEILRVGADFRLKCAGCGHQVMMARPLGEKSTRGLKKAGKSNKAAGGRTDVGSFMIWQSVKECSREGQKARKKQKIYIENLEKVLAKPFLFGIIDIR